MHAVTHPSHVLMTLTRSRQICRAFFVAGVYLKTCAVKPLPLQGIAYDVSVFLSILHSDYMAFLGYKDDTEIGTTPFMPRVEQEFGAPLWVVHRADLQMVLLTAARKAGVDIQTGHHVDVVDFGLHGTTGLYPITKPRYSVNGGEWLEADVILCADGIKSNIRTDMMKIHGQIDHGISHMHLIKLVVYSNIVR